MSRIAHAKVSSGNVSLRIFKKSASLESSFWQIFRVAAQAYLTSHLVSNSAESRRCCFVRSSTIT